MRILTTALAVLAMLSASIVAHAADPVKLRLGHWLPPAHPLQKLGFEKWAKSVEAASKGSIKIDIYPAMQLGHALDHYDMARDGIADITWINPGYQPGRFPVIAAGELPFITDNAKAASKALDAWYRPYAAKEMKDVKFCLVHFHDPGTLHSKKPIRVPADIKGMKVRPGNATMGKFIRQLGGANVKVSAPEARDALERGVADAITFPWNSIIVLGISKVVDHHLDLSLYSTTLSLVINKAAYNKLSKDGKAAIDSHCTSEWAEKFSEGWADNEASGREAIAKLGHKIVKIKDDEQKKWMEASKTLYTQWVDSVKKKGLPAEKMLTDLQEALKKSSDK
ncbi:MAG: TRAP transporter substrate-binding protein [Methyloligellaceae bacterium]